MINQCRLGDPILPLEGDSFTKKTEVPLQILSQTARHPLHVDHLGYWNLNPKRQKLALCAFDVFQEQGWLVTSEFTRKVGPCSFVEIPENSIGMLSLDIKPPIVLRRGDRVGMWDSENGKLQVLKQQRRWLKDTEYGYYDAHDVHGTKIPEQFLHSGKYFHSILVCSFERPDS